MSSKFNQHSSTLLVHGTQHKAEHAVEVLGIDAKPMGFGGALLGYQFERIIVLGYPNRKDVALCHQTEWLGFLKCRLSPTGKLTDIS